MSSIIPSLEPPSTHSITVYFPVSDFKLMALLTRDINRSYEGLGAYAQIYAGDKVGTVFINGMSKIHIVKAAALIAEKTEHLQSLKHK